MHIPITERIITYKLPGKTERKSEEDWLMQKKQNQDHPQTALEKKPTVLFIEKGFIGSAVRAQVRQRSKNTVHTDSLRTAEKICRTFRVSGVVIAAKAKAAIKIASKLDKRGIAENVPRYLVLGKAPDVDLAYKLYLQGFHIVFGLDTDKNRFWEMIRQSITTGPVDVCDQEKTRVDMNAVIENRFEADPKLEKDAVAFSTNKQNVVLMGHVDSLKKKIQFIQKLAVIPGVRSVMGHFVEVT
jgi:hypothetical protein